MTPTLKIAIVIVNFNGKSETRDCLKSLFSLSFPRKRESIQIIVVDNGSTDSSPLFLRRFLANNKFLNCSLIENKENFGFAQGNNIGIKKARENNADYIFLLNNDTVVEKNCLHELLKSCQNHPEVGIAGPKIYFAKGLEYHKEIYQEKDRGRVIWYAGGIIDWNNMLFSHCGVDEVDKGQYDKPGETDFVSGCAMLIKREVLEKIGLFDKNYFLYLEDADLCLRAKKGGFKLWYEPKAFLWHKNASASGKPGSPLHVYYQTRNRLLFGFKYGNTRTKFALWRESIKQLLTDKTKRRAILDFYLENFGKGTIK